MTLTEVQELVRRMLVEGYGRVTITEQTLNEVVALAFQAGSNAGYKAAGERAIEVYDRELTAPINVVIAE